MADKKITDLQLRSAMTDTCNFPIDDTSQTYRMTGSKLWDYILAKIVTIYSTIFAGVLPYFSASQTVSAAGTVLTSASRLVLLDPTSASFTQALPACASLPTGFVLIFKNIALPSNGNVATLDGATTELIDEALTLPLNSYPTMDYATLFNTGTKWLRIG